MDWVMHPSAVQELRAVVRHYAAIASDLAIAFELHFTECQQKICENPLRYNVRMGSVRRVNFGSKFSEYYLPFMVWHDKVVVLAVAHAKRRPYYWRRRVGESKRLY